MVRYMTSKGIYSADDKNKILVDGKIYGVIGFVPQNATERIMDDGVPSFGGKRLYDREGKLNVHLDKDPKPGSRLVARLLSEESKIINPPSKDTIFWAELKRVI